MNIYRRIEIAKKTKCETNCGTAFYIAGVLPEDGVVDIVPTFDYDTTENPPPLNYFSQLPKLDKPEHGCLVLFRHSVMNNFPRHMGTILKEDGKFKLVHRKGPWTDNGSIVNADIIIEDLDEHLDWAKTSNQIVEYYGVIPLEY